MNYYSSPEVKQTDNRVLEKMSNRNITETIKARMNN